MRIAVDGRHLAAGRGVARYSRSMLDALRAAFDEDEWRVVRHGSRVSHLSAALAGRPRVDRMAGGADVVWLPAPAPVAVSRGVPYVVTVHDLSWVERPGEFTAYERWWHRLARLRRLVSGASAVIADSLATADALVSAGWLGDGTVRVIPPGPGIGPPPAPAGAAAPRPSFVVVGALEPRKAVDVALRAHAAARARGLAAELVFAGDGRIAVSGDGVRTVRQPADDELRALYAGALAVVHPAHLEGFGFPPVEGLLHGTPAIVADLPVYGETVGPGALRFAPGDAGALADAMLAIERDAELRARLVAEGQRAVAALSWDRAARETHEVLAEVAR